MRIQPWSVASAALAAVALASLARELADPELRSTAAVAAGLNRHATGDTIALMRDLGVKELPSGIAPLLGSPAVTFPPSYLSDPLPVQMATVLLRCERLREDNREMALASLRVTFERNPTLDANILRYYCLRVVRVPQPANDALGDSGSTVTAATALKSRIQRPSPELANFDRYAAEGCSADPKNAYFPFMRAVGRFAAGRDAEALALIHMAAARPEWREYIRDEIDGRIKLMEREAGSARTLPRLAVSTAALFPHYPQMRAAAESATLLAIREEEKGNRAAGLAIRRDLRECGFRLCRVSSVGIGSMVGTAIVEISLSRPGGRLGRQLGSGVTNDTLKEQLRAENLAYVGRWGAAGEAKRLGRMLDAGSRVRQIVNKSPAQGELYGDMPLRLIRARSLALAAAVAFFSILLFTLAAWLIPVRMAEQALRLTAAEQWLSVGVGFGSATVVLAIAAWELGRSLRADAALAGVFQMLAGVNQSPSNPALPITASSLIGTFAAGVPAALAILFIVTARVRRIPAVVGLHRGFRRAGPAAACLALLWFTAGVQSVARLESQGRSTLDKLLTHEGRYQAAAMHLPWPD